MVDDVARVAASLRPDAKYQSQKDILGAPADVSPMANSTLKRVMDVSIALPLLVFIAPLMLVIALLVRRQDGGPALFRQTRIGRGGRKFTCYKFRTMLIDAPERLHALIERCPQAREEWERTQKLKNDPRITPLGRFLRKSSLDELPQLLNILRGDMTVVGPRPIVFSEIRRYRQDFAYYAALKPGVTGLWQVSGRSDTDYDRRVALDVRYARTSSIRTDVRILFATIPAVLFSKGAC